MLLLTATPSLTWAVHIVQHNLVSDLPGADHTDGNLVNPWGITHGPSTPWWVSDNGTGVSTLYTADGASVAALASSASRISNGAPHTPAADVTFKVRLSIRLAGCESAATEKRFGPGLRSARRAAPRNSAFHAALLRLKPPR